MKISIVLKTAASRTLKSWKGALIIWLCSLLLVSTLAIPVKGVLNSGFGSSMITGRLVNGIDIEVFSDLGDTFRSLISYFSSGFFILTVVGFLLNVFLSGGLFSGLRGSSVNYSAGEFFRASAKNFWSFLAILVITSIIVILLAFLVVVIPLSIVYQVEIPVEGDLFKTFVIVLPAFILLQTIILLVADYARAWQVSGKENACFRAIGFGFSQTFRTFLSSYSLMLILVVVQILYGWLVLKILSGMKPVTEGGVFVLFLLSQFLFFIKILLKVWRYSCVTSLMGMNSKLVIPPAISQLPDQA
jgi:hypothetical protein